MAKEIIATIQIRGFEDPLTAHVWFEGFEDPLTALKQFGVLEEPLFMEIDFKGAPKSITANTKPG